VVGMTAVPVRYTLRKVQELQSLWTSILGVFSNILLVVSGPVSTFVLSLFFLQTSFLKY
jgi:hypothetical protein